MTLPRAIFFDLDDTILANDTILESCWGDACALEAARAGGKFRGEDLAREIHRLREWYWADPVRHRKGRMNMTAARAEITQLALEALGHGDRDGARRVAVSYENLMQERLTPFPGAMETLRWLRGRGTTMVLITNGAAAYQRAKVERFQLEKYFDHVLIEGELGYGKPDVEVYHEALRRTGLTADQAWMVGDRLDWEVEAPQSIGIKGVWNDHRKKGLPTGTRVQPFRVVHSIAELMG